jgi:hypothetical protein
MMMFSSSAATAVEAMTGASQRTQAVIGFAGRSAGNEWGQSEEHRSFWESPRRGTVQAAQHKRACMGGREVRIRVSDGPVMDRSGCPCSINRMTDFKRAG